jgi:hypothetical protein
VIQLGPAWPLVAAKLLGIEPERMATMMAERDGAAAPPAPAHDVGAAPRTGAANADLPPELAAVAAELSPQEAQLAMSVWKTATPEVRALLLGELKKQRSPKEAADMVRALLRQMAEKQAKAATGPSNGTRGSNGTNGSGGGHV